MPGAGRAAPRRGRKLFPARKLSGSAAADRLPAPAARTRGRPFPGRGARPAGRGLGEPGLHQVGAGTLSPAALSPPPRTQPRRRRHERVRPGVAVPKLPPPFAAAAHRVLCVSLASVGRSNARLTADGLAHHAGSRVPRRQSLARPEEEGRGGASVDRCWLPAVNAKGKPGLPTGDSAR